jgi:two-component system CheB/CheR fusion protein
MPGRPGETLHYDVQVVPLIEQTGLLLGVSVSFIDLTQSKRLEEELERANFELTTAYEELQSAKEELETTNEELQSTVEELETTNEELQSANEELETMNEELQSTNDELQSMNNEGHIRAEELYRVNTFLSNILGNLQAGIAVLDRSLAVLVWSPKAEDLWGLRSEEVVGRPFLKLDIGLPVERLKQPLRDCLDGGPARQVVTLEGVNRRGRPILCQVTCSSLAGESTDGGDLLLIMEELSAG